MSNVNLQTLEPVSSMRQGPLNGPPSSQDYNDTNLEMLTDFATLYDFINQVIIPLLNTLPDTSIGPPVLGLEGATLYSDTSDTGALFFDPNSSTPLTLANSLRQLNTMISSQSQLLTDLGVNVASLQARLASTNQNDIALALQNMTNTLNTLTTQISSTQGQVNEVTTYLSNSQKARVSTGSVAANSSASVTVTWQVPFTDTPTTYIVNYAMEDSTGSLTVASFSYITDGSGIHVKVVNGTGSAVTGHVHVTAIGPNTF